MAMTLQDLRKMSERRCGGFSSLLAVRSRHDAGSPAVVLDRNNRVFLVKHSYVSGWQLPGGGVEVGETSAMRWRRELGGGGRIEVLGEPALHACSSTAHVSRGTMSRSI